MTIDWNAVAARLETRADSSQWGQVLKPEDGQRNAVAAIAARIRGGQRSLLLADEVGMGKTLIAAALIKAVQSEGGRSAVVIPPGLGAQWQAELRRLDPGDGTLLPLRSYRTFLDVFRRPEDESNRPLIRGRRARELTDRRQQRELPEGGWCDEPILLLSHNLGNIWSTADAQVWHRALVDSIRKVAGGTRRYRRDPKDGMPHNIAREAAERILKQLGEAERNALVERAEDKDIPLVEKLRAIVASGLGQFDLVVIDEAHKARGTTTSLGRVLGDMTWKGADAFRLGLTATPVELDPQQWIDTLSRLNVPKGTLAALRPVIDAYVKVVDDLRMKIALTSETVERYREAAARFQALLSPWVLRRDQREDSFVQDFHRRHGSHRLQIPIEVSLADMPLMWKRAFLASEAMSLLAEHTLTPAQRRLRLSLPDGRRVKGQEDASGDAAIDPKTRGQRAWAALAGEATENGGAAIFSHPAITRTVTEIEALVARGQKVLVFGRFTHPMRALSSMLDAREMVRRLCAEEGPSTRWPASKLGVESHGQKAALQAALDDPTVNVAAFNRVDVEQRMAGRAARHDAERRSNLAEIRSAIARIGAGSALAALLSEAWRSGAGDAGLLAALEDQRPPVERQAPWTEHTVLAAFEALVREIRGQGDVGEDNDGEQGTPQRFPELLNAHLADFSSREGHFARLMDGSTAPQTRRLLQAAFNREGSWPQVLVAQSTVGREGLNLQAACRVVVMLHLEWNPGNVEQQIGRVDRIGSRWRNEAAAYERTSGSDIPRILIRPVLVRGTYADHQWSVLARRWDSLRAQLNGEVLALGDLGGQCEDLTRLLEGVRDAAPNFSPPQYFLK